MKAIIVDDEKNAREVLQFLINETASDFSIVALCSSADEGYAAIKKHEPDVVFLDIEMPKKSGFDMLLELGDINFQVIFTTAYDKYAVRAFKFSALDYLLKPVSQSDLLPALEKLRKHTGQPSTGKEQVELLIENMLRKDKPVNRLALYTHDGVRFIDPEKVMRCESNSNYTSFYFDTGEKIVSSRTLKDVEEIFSHFSFYRVHNSHLINLGFVERYSKEDGGTVIMTDGKEIAVSRSRKNEFLDLFSKI